MSRKDVLPYDHSHFPPLGISSEKNMGPDIPSATPMDRMTDTCEIITCPQFRRRVETLNKQVSGVVKADIVIPDIAGRAAMVSTSGIEVGTRVCAVTSGGTWKRTQIITSNNRKTGVTIVVLLNRFKT